MSRSTCFALLACLCLIAALPAFAGEIYENGPINGDSDAWTINFGFIVSDTFTIAGGNSTITGVSFGVWLFIGDELNTVEVSLTSNENGGTVYFDQTVAFTTSNCGGNSYGYNLCTASGSFNGPTLGNGTYWLNLQNATLLNGDDPVYWDENSGEGCHSPGCPSLASENTVGTIPSESFTILGTSSTTTTTGTVPEPGSLMLFAGGALSIASLLRRKLG